VTVNDGPMADGPEREVDVDYVSGVDFDHVEDPDHGEHVAISVHLSKPAYEYHGPVHGNGVYDVLEQHGVPKPTDTPVYGVQIDNDMSTVDVEAYLPLGGDN
jgi:hypothetical protein